MSGPIVIRIEGLPQAPLDAAAAFYEYLPDARGALAHADALTLVFPTASHGHHAWRLAAVQELAREAAPRRVNAVVGDRQEDLAACANWLADREGITGQILMVDGTSAGKD